jgi:hypothetical protein
MIYVTTHCEKNTAILSTEFVIHKPLKNCKDRTEPQNQVGQQMSSDPLR